MNLALHTGNLALHHVRSDDFQLKWKKLYARCPWVTAFQHPDFVTPWYELYQTQFLPVIILAEAEDESLTGLLTLAFCKEGKQLVGAGERQAEYQGWLEAKDAGNIFIRDAVKKIRNHFPGVDLRLKYLPPDIPLNWILDNREYSRIFSLRSHPRPIMKINEAAMSSQRNKKTYRRNFGRLKKSGDVQFETITRHDQFIRVFDELCTQYDFRQGTLYRHMPFSSDPAKKLLYLELHKRGLLHTTILTVDGEIAASHSGLLSNDSTLHMGISTHAPSFAAHSPGTLLLSMLGVHVVKEKISVLDLTPGGDGYKEKFATEHDVVFELTAYGDVKARLRKEAYLSGKRFLKNRMHQAGLRTADAWAAMGKLSSFKELGFHGLLARLRDAAISPPCLYRYCADKPRAAANPLLISKDSLSDIVRFDPSGSPITRWEFLNMATERLERSNHLYSFRSDEKLFMCCWVDARPAGSNQQLAGHASAFSENAVVLFDLYVHRQVKDEELVRRFIEQILSELTDCHKTKAIYFSGALSDELQAEIKHCGFSDLPGRRDDLPAVATRRRYAELFRKGRKWIQK
ncbi:GNAT family N-acetyltransferase [Noviherbaspirillum sedimenti]|uniref:GNAT family N-acetyltransferase n=1 Tax=Noviherbaspirillum sedimenti TaxID=2320865 RepID=A0A3A3FYN5_9BURK|nr:GNAT family N-acetyltransferase [Noviherbaspirillum sedimenti]RJG01283.1 GNAT family N-acetyltransferase [Noviherbaspirillum sedimenti]